MPLSVAPRRALDKAQVQRISELITDHEEQRDSNVQRDRNDEVISSVGSQEDLIVIFVGTSNRRDRPVAGEV